MNPRTSESLDFELSFDLFDSEISLETSDSKKKFSYWWNRLKPSLSFSESSCDSWWREDFCRISRWAIRGWISTKYMVCLNYLHESFSYSMSNNHWICVGSNNKTSLDCDTSDMFHVSEILLVYHAFYKIQKDARQKIGIVMKFSREFETSLSKQTTKSR